MSHVCFLNTTASGRHVNRVPASRAGQFLSKSLCGTRIPSRILISRGPRAVRTACWNSLDNQAPVENLDVGGSRLVLQEKEERNWAGKRLSGVLKGAAILGCACLLALGSPDFADAARSGGRMGGSAFRSRSSPSYSYSSPRSYGGGVTTRSSPSVSFNSFFVPWGFGYGYGYGSPMGMGGGGGLINLLFLGFAFWVAVNVLQNFLGNQEGGISLGSERVAVAKVQVGLLGLARGLQRDLDKLARYADTSDPEGLHYVLQETILALNRNPDYCVYGSAAVKNEGGPESAENRFNEWSLQERGKFREETLSNIGGRTTQKTMTGSAAEGQNELVVVTILVAAEGGLKLPKITSRDELRTVLNRLGAIRADSVMAVEVLWTPQDERDSYTRDELVADYPALYTL